MTVPATTEIRFAQHAPTSFFPVVDGQIAPGGIPIGRLAERVGRTPFYVYDRAAISMRVQSLRAALPAALHLHYAIKANPMPAVVQHLAALTDGLDVASAQEMRVALDTGIAPQRVSFAGPGKTAAEIRQAVAAGITVTVESALQLEQAVAAGEALGVRPRVAVRVNPAFELKSSGMRMGGGPKPFGIDEAKVPEVLDRVRADGAHLCGLHIFGGSQNLRAEAIVDAQQKTYELGLSLLRHWAAPVEWLNLGGGLGVPYFPNEHELDLAPVACTACASARTPISMRRWSSSWAATWSRTPGCMCAGCSIARNPAARCSSSPTAACTITWRPRATSAKCCARTIRWPWPTASRRRSTRCRRWWGPCARRSTSLPTA